MECGGIKLIFFFFFEKTEHELNWNFMIEDIALESFNVFVKNQNLTILNENHDEQINSIRIMVT